MGPLPRCSALAPKGVHALREHHVESLCPRLTVTGPTLASSRDWGTLGFAMWSGGQRACGHLEKVVHCRLVGTRNEDPTKRACGAVVSKIKRTLVSPVGKSKFPSHINPLHLSTQSPWLYLVSFFLATLVSSQAPPPKQPRCWQCFSTRTSWARIRLTLS